MSRRPIVHHVVAFMVVSVIAASPATAFNEPDGFRGLPWGAPEDDVRMKQSGPVMCSDYPFESRWIGDRSCRGGFMLGGVDVTTVYMLRANRFISVRLSFPSQDFEWVAAVFVERYGTPTTSAREPFRTQGGAEATNQIYRWSGPTVEITLQRFSGDITHGSASLGTRKDMEESARLRQQQIKENAREL